jgi:hypothetical protein
MSTNIENHQFQVARLGIRVADANDSNAVQSWSTVCSSTPDPVVGVSPITKGLSYVESCGEFAAMVDIEPRWTYIEFGEAEGDAK